MKPVPVRNPPNPWDSREIEHLGEPPAIRFEILEDESRSIVSDNDSPDLGFKYSVNPYRGCQHACAYCYARPSHEHLGFGAGTDFDRRIVVKPRAPELLREAFERPGWTGELILFSGNTDCYQPLEASYRLTRGCLEVATEYRNPIHVITKSALIERDIDVLARHADVAHSGVTVSVPLWDEAQARALEPYAPTPKRRIETIRRLASAGLRVTVNVAPVIPGLGDDDIPAILTAARRAGAVSAGMILLRLPGPVKSVFTERLAAAFPLRAARVIARTREVRGGKLNDAAFGERMRGRGQYYDAIQSLFDGTARRLGFESASFSSSESGDVPVVEPAERTFRRPTDRGGQLRLFG